MTVESHLHGCAAGRVSVASRGEIGSRAILVAGLEGRARVVWAGDYSWMKYGEGRSAAALPGAPVERVPDGDPRRRILWVNPARLFLVR